MAISKLECTYLIRLDLICFYLILLYLIRVKERLWRLGLAWLKKSGMFFIIFLLCSPAFASLPKEEEKQTLNSHFAIRLKQAPLVATLQQLATTFQQDLVIDDELSGTISLQLQQTQFEALLQAVAQIKQLALWQENQIYYLAKDPNLSPLEAELAQASWFDPRLDSDTSTPILPSLVTATVKLKFAKAADIIEALQSKIGSPLLSSQGSLSFDKRSNLILIQDQSPYVNNIKKLIKEMDSPIEQIIIEARIVTISDESLQELGVRWGIFHPSAQSAKIAGSLDAQGFAALTDQLNVNFATTNPAASVALQIAKINGRLLDLELTALERENNVEIIASPRLLTTNKQTANIKQGTDIPYVILDNKNNLQSFEFREAVLGLEVTPHITQNKGILLDLQVTQNAMGNNIAVGQNAATTIDKQEITTQVLAQDGETIVLGGIFHHSIAKQLDKVPLLGDIPLIKRLFSREMQRQQKRELVIFVTPHIIKPATSQ